MKRIIRINEFTYNRLFLSENRINLQLINGYFYPTDSISRDILVKKYGLERISKDGFDRWTPTFVHDGYKLAVTGYEPEPAKEHEPPRGRIGGEPRATKNPCIKCRMNGMCDSDECGRKGFKIDKDIKNRY